MNILRLLPLPFLVAICSASMSPVGLRCESRIDPLGIDIAQPLLSWQLVDGGDVRGQYQTAYQIQVASSIRLLGADRADLWDSGRVTSRDTMQVAYRGSTLASGRACYWHVKVWDAQGHVSTWSKPARWSMGMLRPSDWKAQWIGDPLLASPANRPLTPIQCYRSQLTTHPNTVKSIVLDLGRVQSFDSVDLIPARPQGQNGDFRTPMFPVRFRIEVCNDSHFTSALTVVNHTEADFPSPRENSCRFGFHPVNARYIRLTVTRLARWDGQDYGLALGGMAVFSGSRAVTAANVECSDSLETDRWSKRYLLGAHTQTVLAEDSPAIRAGMDDVAAKAQVSRVPLLRREFSVPRGVRRATLYVAARGFYEMRINGRRVGDDLLAPGFTDYNQRIQYQTYDVTSSLHRGQNALGALLGYGWYAGHMNLFENRCFYGYFPQLLAQLDVELSDGSHVTVGTDSKWRSTLKGPVRWSDLLDGEGYDERRALSKWDRIGFDDRSWSPVWSQPLDGTALVWQRTQPVRKVREIRPVAVKTVGPNTYVFDFGEEITGWCRLKALAQNGAHLRLRHSELIAQDGNIDVKNLWGTPQQDDYILHGAGERTLEPHFTYHGFRYVELSGFKEKLKPDTLVAVNIRTDAPVTGHFECSNELYNRIQRAAMRTQANLLFDVPAGCAARAERLAWTGDIRPCVPSLLLNFDAAPLLTKYTQDLRDDQKSDGRFTDIAPHAHLTGTDTCVGSPGWADAGVSLPWDVYVQNGDRRLLSQHFEAARRWVDFIHKNNPDLIWRNHRGMDWGDWLSAGTATPKELGATAFFAHSADLVARMARVLGRNEEANQYRTLFQNIRLAFKRAYVDSNGTIADRKPTSRDVTSSVQALISNGKLKFVVGNEVLGGDPAPNRKKRLHLVYASGARDFNEGETVDLEGDDRLLSATYGDSSIDTQGSYALALQFHLLDPPLRAKAAKRLDELVKENAYHPTTGFWSSIESLLALSETGSHADAARMLDQRQEPSWGYMVDQSTTMWEAFNANSQNLSLNHWTHSAVSEWLWRNIAGINPDEDHPGYQTFTIHPRPTPEVSWCHVGYDSPRGRIVSEWRWEGQTFSQTVTVPVNTSATIYIPTSDPTSVSESGIKAAKAKGLKFLRYEPGMAIYQARSGTYHFHSELAQGSAVLTPRSVK